ncbi:hypothetical protein CSKR_203390 [Clonorchis sinensis]|uniref:Uncharacterized protein n=1 Tax=Clonorchis sinensis TaxID=79923 RepID=A0A8T1MAE8_CLOSI|nr:hypothetical protein CSKR_203390 [Clonorchis sinensis]
MTAPNVDSTCARRRPSDHLSLYAPRPPKCNFELKHLSSMPQYVTQPRESVPCSSQDKWTLLRPPHNYMTSTSNFTYRKLGETSHPQIPAASSDPYVLSPFCSHTSPNCGPFSGVTHPPTPAISSCTISLSTSDDVNDLASQNTSHFPNTSKCTADF